MTEQEWIARGKEAYARMDCKISLNSNFVHIKIRIKNMNAKGKGNWGIILYKLPWFGYELKILDRYFFSHYNQESL